MLRIRHRDKLFKKMERKLSYERRKEKYGKSWADFIRSQCNKK